MDIKFIIPVSILVLMIGLGSYFQWDNNLDEFLEKEELAKHIPTVGRDNGYISSASCKSCHPNEYASWHDSFHRTMTQAALPGNIYGNFDGTTVHSHGMPYSVYTSNNQFRVKMPDPDIVMAMYAGKMNVEKSKVPMVDRQVVLATGSHHYQTYWVESPRYDTLMQTLPLVYLMHEDKWIPREEAFMRAPGDKHQFITQWNHHCIRCHSTGGNPGLQKPGTTREGQLVTEVGEFGISCEACHGPAKDHINFYTNPINRYKDHTISDTSREIVNPAKLGHKRSSEVCGQCHGVYIDNDKTASVFKYHGVQYRPGEKINDYRKYIFHPETIGLDKTHEEFLNNEKFFGERWWEDGSILAGGREYTAMAVSGCYTKGEMSCMSCHTMHGGTKVDQMRLDVSGDSMCTQCHSEPEFTSNLVQHTKHKTTSEGSRCVNCHMPRNSYALFGAISSHQIQSPNTKSIATHDVPNACNLCHLDKSINWTLDKLSQNYGLEKTTFNHDYKDISAAVRWILHGDAKRRAITAWHMGWKPAKEVSGSGWMAPFLALNLKDTYGVVRFITHKALSTQSGFEDFSYDFLGDKETLQKAVTLAAEMWESTFENDIPQDSNVLVSPDGQFNHSLAREMLINRDRSPVTISE